MRKLFSLFLALVATTSLWAHHFKVDGIYYNHLDGNNVKVTYRGNDYYSYDEYAGEVIIPSTVTYNGTTYGVTSIGTSAFSGCSSLTSITIPNSVTSIGDEAFRDCSSLTSVTIGNSVTSIGNWAFYDCSSLTSITIPNSVTSIGYWAFAYCTSLTSITIPNSVTSIGHSAFYSCSSLTSVTIPNSVTSIGDGAFYHCSSLTSPLYNAHCFAYMPTSFKGAYVIPEGIKQIAGGAFEDCSSLTSITIPNSVTSIGESAFRDCSSLTSVTIGNSVTSIGNWAFDRCSSLTSITIPNSVTSIGNYAFSYCSSLATVTIGNSVTSIGDEAFSGCSSLTSIVIPNSVTSIGDRAFAYCSSLTSVTIGNSVTSIGDRAFEGCSSLATITIPNSVTSIGSSAFYECSSLTSITIGNSVTSIGDRAFSWCSSLTKTNYTGDIAGWCDIKFGGYKANPMCYSHNFYINDQEIKDLVISNTVDSIHDYAFSGCSSLTSITIPNSVTSIGNHAFSGCSSLTSITIPNSVTSIGNSAFYYCSSLTSVTIGNSVTSIGYEAFFNCSSLNSITIPNSVTSIGDEAFAYCSSLTSITCEATRPPTIESATFYGVSKSIPVYIPCSTISAYNTAQYWNEFTNFQEPLAEYSINVSTANNQMGTAKVDFNNCATAQISATANYHHYCFVQWSDGNTDNPRTLVLTQDTTFTAEFAQAYSGQCGDSLYWEYDSTNKTISITGSGDMYNYTANTQPWLLFKEEIAEVTISNTATSIGTSAFEGCIRLGKVSIGTATKNIAANAFAACTKLYDIYCLAAEPPTGYTSSFANYNTFLHVPCESQRLYMLDILFGEFKYIECIASDEVPTDDIVITPGSTDVTITWPTEGNADTYTIVIKKDGEVVCTLTFNAEGQLLNIAFAPGRNGNHPVQYAEAVANGGYRFTVTGLTESTDYTYDITVKDASNKTIKSHSGKFTTESLTAVENTHIQSPISNCQKILRDGQLLILRDGVEYNAMGQEL